MDERWQTTIAGGGRGANRAVGTVGSGSGGGAARGGSSAGAGGAAGGPETDLSVWTRKSLLCPAGLGFHFFEGPKHYGAAREKPPVIRQREDFIDTLRQYLAMGKVIHDTWANKNMSLYRSWNDGDLHARLDQPSGDGGRIFFAHVGSPETHCVHCVLYGSNCILQCSDFCFMGTTTRTAQWHASDDAPVANDCSA